ncbi:mucin-5AC-like [Glossina fuscipes]|uniref:Mucin-5AC-like n=1 Tax=Glossina fuscipes TaxID=7396 RepID=A0A9C6DXC4_9MUSC|nr:mucin-5AC-like [Glossina fuscipes]
MQVVLTYISAESHYYPPASPYHELPPILPPSRPYPYQNYLPPRLYYFPQPIQRYLLPIELYGQRYPPLIISPAGQLYPPPNLYYVPQSVEATSSPTQYYEPSIVSPAQSSASSQCIFCVVNVQSPQNNLPSKEPRSSQLPSSISDSQSAPAKASILELPSHQSPPSEIGLGPLSQPSQARQSLSSESPSKPVALQSLSSPLGSESTLGKQSYPEQLLREPSLSEAALQSPLHQLAPLGPASLQSFPSQTHLESTKCSTQLSEPSQGTSAFQTASSGSHSLSPPHLSVSSASSTERPHPSSAAILGSEQVSGAELTSKLPPYQRPASETVLQQPSDEPVPLQPSSSQSIPKAGTAQSSVSSSDSESILAPHHSDMSASPRELKPHSSSVAIPGSEQVSGAELGSKLLPYQRPASEIVLQQPSHEPIPLQPLSSQSIPKVGTSYSSASTSDSESILGKKSSQQQPLRQPSWSEAALQSPLHQLAPLGPQSFPSQNHPEATERQIKPLEPSQEKSTLQSPSSESHSQSAPYQSVSSVSSAELRPQSSSAATPGSEQLLSKELTSKLPPYQRPASETSLEQETSQLLLPQLLPASSARQTTLSQPSREPISSQPSLSGSPSKTGTSQSSPSTSDSESTLGKQSRPQQPVRHPSLSEAALDSSLHQSAPLGPRSHQSFPSQTRPESTKRSILLSEPFQETSTLQSELSKPQSLSAPHQSVSSASSAELRPLSSSAAIPGSEQVSGAELTSKLPPYQRPASEIALERETPQILLTQLPPGSLAHQTPLSLSSQELVVREESSPESSPNTASLSAPHQSVSSAPSAEQRPHSSSAAIPGSEQASGAELTSKLPPYQRPASEIALKRETRQILLTQLPPGSLAHQTPLSLSSQELVIREESSPESSPNTAAYQSSPSISNSESALGKKPSPQQSMRQPSLSEVALQSPLHQSAPLGPLQSFPSQTHPESTKRSILLPEPSQETSALQSVSSAELRPHLSLAAIPGSEQLSGEELTSKLLPYQRPASETALEQETPQHLPSQLPLGSSAHQTPLSKPSQELLIHKESSPDSSSNTAAYVSSPSMSDTESTLGEEPSPQQSMRQPSSSETALNSPLHQSAELGLASLQSFPSQTHLESTKRSTQLTEASQETSTLQSTSSKPHSLSAPHQSVSSGSFAEVRPHPSSAAVPGYEQVSGKELTSKLSPYQRLASETASERETPQISLPQLLPGSSARQTSLSQPSEELVVHKEFSPESSSNTAAYQSSPSMSSAESTLGKQPSPQQSLRQPSLPQALQSPLHHSAELGLASLQSFPSQTHPESTKRPSQLSELSQEKSALQSLSSGSHSLSAPHLSVTSASSTELKPHSSSAAILGSEQVSDAELTSKMPPYQRPASETVLQQQSHERVPLQPLSSQSIPKAGTSQSSASTSDSGSILGKESSQQQPLRQPSWSEIALQSPLHQLAPLGPASLQSSQSQTHPESTKRSIQLSEPSQGTSALQIASSGSLSAPHHSDTSASSTELRQHSPSAAIIGSEQVSGAELTSKLPPYQRPASETALQQPSHEPVPLQPPSLQSPSKAGTSQSSPSTSDSESTLGKQSSPQHHPSLSEAALDSSLHQSVPLGPRPLQSFSLQNHPERQIQPLEPSQEKLTLQSPSSESHSQSAPYQSVSSASSKERTPYSSSAAIPVAEQVSGEELTSSLLPYQRPALENGLEPETQQLLLPRLPPGSSARQTPLSEVTKEPITPKSPSSKSPSKTVASQSSPSTSESESTLGKYPSPQQPVRQLSLSETALESPLHQSAPLGPASPHSFPSQTHLESTKRSTRQSEPSQETSRLQSASSNSLARSAPHQSVSSASSKEHIPHSSSAAIPGSEHVSGEELISKLPPFQRPALETALEQKTRRLHLSQLPPESSARQTSSSQPSHKSGPLQPLSSQSPSKAGTSQSSPSTSDSESTLGKQSSPHHHPSLSEAALDSSLHQSVPLGPRPLQSFSLQNHPERQIQPLEPSQEKLTLQSPSSESHSQSSPHQSVSSASSVELRPHSSSAAILGSEQVSGEELTSKQPPYQKPASETALERETPQLFPTQLSPGSSARQTPVSHVSKEPITPKSPSSESPSKTVASQSSPSTSESESTLGKYPSPQQPLRQSSLSETALQSPLHQSAPLGPGSLQSVQSQLHPESTKRSTQLSESPREYLTLQPASSESRSLSAPHQSGSSTSSTELTPHSPSAATPDSEQVLDKAEILQPPPHQRPQSKTPLAQGARNLLLPEPPSGLSVSQKSPSHKPVPLQSSSSQSASKTGTSQPAPSTSDSELTLGKQSAPQQPLRVLSLPETALESLPRQSAPVKTQLSEPSPESISSKSYSQSAPHQSASSASSATLTPHQSSSLSLGLESTSDIAPTSKPPLYQNPSSETALEQETQPKPPQTPLPGESSPGQAPLFTRLVATESTTDKVSSSEQTPRQALLKEPESESILHQSTLLATAAAQGSLPSQSHLESTTQETLQSEPSQETQTRRPTSKHPLPVSAEYEEPSLRQSPTKSVTRLSAQSTSAPELTTRQPATSEPSLNLKKTPSGVGPTKSPLPSSKKSSKGTTPPPKKKKKKSYEAGPRPPFGQVYRFG